MSSMMQDLQAGGIHICSGHWLILFKHNKEFFKEKIRARAVNQFEKTHKRQFPLSMKIPAA